MTTVACGSVVELLDPLTLEWELVPIETLSPGDRVATGEANRVAKVRHMLKVVDTYRMMPLARFAGACLHPGQVVFFGGRWIAAGSVDGAVCGEEPCRGMVGLVLEDVRHVRVDGVVCRTLDPERTAQYVAARNAARAHAAEETGEEGGVEEEGALSRPPPCTPPTTWPSIPAFMSPAAWEAAATPVKKRPREQEDVSSEKSRACAQPYYERVRVRMGARVHVAA